MAFILQVRVNPLAMALLFSLFLVCLFVCFFLSLRINFASGNFTMVFSESDVI